jgi:hypothetical protein
MLLNGLPGRKRLVAPWAGFITTSMTPAAPGTHPSRGSICPAPAPGHETTATPGMLHTSTRRLHGRSAGCRRTSVMLRAESRRPFDLGFHHGSFGWINAGAAGTLGPTVYARLPSGSLVAALTGLRKVLGYPDYAFPTRGRGGRSATARDVGGHARPFEPASGVS